MLKPLTLSLSLAVALGLCGVSKAGLHDKLASGQACASEQCPKPSSQCAKPSAQCAPKKSCLSGLFQHKPKTYCYEWVLKKKKCKSGGCDVCGSPVYATGQASGQMTYGSGQVYGAGQTGGTMAPATGDEAPPAPPAPTDGAAPADMPGAPTGTPVAPPAANNGQGSLLFLAPAGN